MTAHLSYRAGTLELRGLDRAPGRSGDAFLVDEREGCLRGPGLAYARLRLDLRAAGIDVDDHARAYDELTLDDDGVPPLRDYQQAALHAWEHQRGRGLVVLPTGAGKTVVALAAIARVHRSTLVVVPTLDLLRQWHERLEDAFSTTVGVIGGGTHDRRSLTVATYDSAHLHMEHLGARFGFVVFDEAHHLPSPAYALAARMCIAPFRLGLTATPEREDGREVDLDELIGPVAHRVQIGDLAGDHLAAYDTERIEVPLTDEQRRDYDVERGIYRAFLREQGIRVASPGGWATFLIRAGGSADGQRALLAYRRQKKLAQAAPQKVALVDELLQKSPRDRALVFTHDNETAYEIARALLLPVITHQTKVRERTAYLRAFRDGRLPVLVSSRVLNEGVDVPEASLAIVVSGTGTVREHVQRLGRILRPRDGKRARLVELVSADTGETFTSERRRQHDAYR